MQIFWNFHKNVSRETKIARKNVSRETIMKMRRMFHVEQQGRVKDVSRETMTSLTNNEDVSHEKMTSLTNSEDVSRETLFADCDSNSMPRFTSFGQTRYFVPLAPELFGTPLCMTQERF